MKKSVLRSVIAIGLVTTAYLFSIETMAADCGHIVVNCKTHKISIRGKLSTIDCGRHTSEEDETISGSGTVGSYFLTPAPNDPVHEAIDIDDMSGMGMTNGNGKVLRSCNSPRRDPSYVPVFATISL